MTEVKGSFKRLKLIDVPGAQHILEQIPPENWHESVEKGGLDLGGPNGRFKIHMSDYLLVGALKATVTDGIETSIYGSWG